VTSGTARSVRKSRNGSSEVLAVPISPESRKTSADRPDPNHRLAPEALLRPPLRAHEAYSVTGCSPIHGHDDTAFQHIDEPVRVMAVNRIMTTRRIFDRKDLNFFFLENPAKWLLHQRSDLCILCNQRAAQQRQYEQKLLHRYLLLSMRCGLTFSVTGSKECTRLAKGMRIAANPQGAQHKETWRKWMSEPPRITCDISSLCNHLPYRSRHIVVARSARNLAIAARPSP
jgi:hypothetical protein